LCRSTNLTLIFTDIEFKNCVSKDSACNQFTLSVGYVFLLFSAFCQGLTAIMYGSEVDKVEGSYLKGTYALVILSMLLSIGLPIIVYFDKRNRYPSGNVFIETNQKSKNSETRSTSGRHISMSSNSDRVDARRKPVATIESQSSNMRRSVSSLSEADTYRKFAYFEEGPCVNPSTLSLGSATSLNTRSEAYTQVSYLTDKSSVESRI